MIGRSRSHSRHLQVPSDARALYTIAFAKLKIVIQSLTIMMVISPPAPRMSQRTLPFVL